MRHFLLLFVSFCSFSVIANSLPNEPYVSVVGSASLSVKADQVIINFQPTAINDSAIIAKKQVDQQIALLFNNLTQAGFVTDKVESLSQSTRPEYQYQKNERKLMGVRVTYELSYHLNDITKVNEFMDALLNSKIETVSPLQYGLQSPQQWQGKVREMAVLDSKVKAQDLARLYDAKLGAVYSINYQNNEARPVLMHSMAMESKKSNVVDIKPRNIELNDRVETTFLLTH
ncbi:SIMPL domain-containing protein [Psychromonas sp. KJ10-10]|uniref:SIMPL domain-containing protein n=1 Tax=Psychromonas sp. KJ10-10 TaxID=3391823 RepID=UPI0039B523FD